MNCHDVEERFGLLQHHRSFVVFENFINIIDKMSRYVNKTPKNV